MHSEIILSILDELDNATVSLDKQKDELEKKLSRLDSEVADIHHYIEFNQLNAVNGYKAYKMLHECLVIRRNVKDDLSLVASLYSRGVSKSSIQKTKELSMKQKTYVPRIRKELFEEDGI